MKQNGTKSASETRKCPGCHDMPVLYALSCQPRWHNTQTWVLCQQEHLLSFHESGSCHRHWHWATPSWPATERRFSQRSSSSYSATATSRHSGTQRAPRVCPQNVPKGHSCWCLAGWLADQLPSGMAGWHSGAGRIVSNNRHCGHCHEQECVRSSVLH